MRGKNWDRDEEKKLMELADKGLTLEVIAAQLEKTPGAVYEKAKRIGVVIKDASSTTHEIKLPRELPSVEEALKILAGALNASAKPGLSKVEVQRLQTVAVLARTYEKLVANYVDYRGIENRLIDLAKEYEELAKPYKLAPAKAQTLNPIVNPKPLEEEDGKSELETNEV